MKIGIITYHFPLNYGAVLQAYAFSHVLESLGHDVKIIDYQPMSHVKRYSWSWKRMGINGQNLRYLKLSKKFAKFRDAHLRTTRPYYTAEELKANPPEADAFICGSDQIWNQTTFGENTPYFLDFAPPSAYRISYAASFGKSHIDEYYRPKLKKLLANINSISVREQSGCNIIKELCGRESTCVLDPTLLLNLNSYSKITDPLSYSGKYILVKGVQHTPLLDKVVSLTSKTTGLPVIYIHSMSVKFWKYLNKTRVYPGPSGYLGFFKNAEYVITESFHGTTFALIFGKRFLSVSLSGDPTKNTSVRITNLLDSVGLRNHFIETLDENHIKNLIERDIEWASVESSLSMLRQNSIKFLKEALK
jgi:hypothetical protein